MTAVEPTAAEANAEAYVAWEREREALAAYRESRTRADVHPEAHFPEQRASEALYATVYPAAVEVGPGGTVWTAEGLLTVSDAEDDDRGRYRLSDGNGYVEVWGENGRVSRTVTIRDAE